MLLEDKNAVIYGAGGAIGGALRSPPPSPGKGLRSSSPGAPGSWLFGEVADDPQTMVFRNATRAMNKPAKGVSK
jgi:hypothetical protein